MFIQASLPLLPFSPARAKKRIPSGPGSHLPAPFESGRLPAAARSDADIETVRSAFETQYVELRKGGGIERVRGFGAASAWALDPYRGNEWDDPFEADRVSRRLLRPGHPRGSRTRVFVKTRVADSLRRQLQREGRRDRRAMRSLIIGAGADPYQPAEKHFLITRSLLEGLLGFRGLNLSIETRSPLIARDLDLLTELDSRHAVEVTIPIATLEGELARRLEPSAPPPDARMRTVERLSQEGLSTHVRCHPLLPGINTSEEWLRPLFEAARRAGAQDVTGSIFSLSPAARGWFFPWLEREFPRHVGHYREVFGWRDHLNPAQREMALAPFQRLRLAMGFPRPTIGRG